MTPPTQSPQPAQSPKPAQPAQPRPAQPHSALRALDAAENALIVALLAGTVLTILAQILFRYALGQPLSWSTEVATDLLVYIAFVGFAIGIRDNAHVALHLFADRLGVRSRRWMRVGELVVLGVVLGCIGIGGAMYAYQQRDVTSPSDIPLWLPFLALPLGAVLGWVHLVVEITALLRGANASTALPRGANASTALPRGANASTALPHGTNASTALPHGTNASTA